MRRLPAYGANIKSILKLAQPIGIVVHDSNVARFLGQVLGQVAADFTGPEDNVGNRRLVFNGQSGTATASSPGGPDHDYHGILVDADNQEVMLATNEATNQPVTETNTIVFGQFSIDVLQPSQAFYSLGGVQKPHDPQTVISQMGIRTE